MSSTRNNSSSLANPVTASSELISAPGAIDALLNAGGAMAGPQKAGTPDAMSFVIVPDGFSVQATPVMHVPLRPAGTVKLRDVASFIEYWKAHRVARSRIYATLDPAVFLAVFDDFGVSSTLVDSTYGQTDWRQFRASFAVPMSREWSTWTKMDRRPVDQLTFAQHLEDNLPDVVTPDGASLYEMALKFEASSKGSFVSTQRMQDGSHDLQWKADNNSAGTVKLPELIKLRIPVFENSEPSDLDARLRYRVKEGALSLWFELIRPHKVLESAFRAAWATIEGECSTKILLGTPE